MNPIMYIETTYGVELKKVGRTEYAGPCPWCGGNDRFHVWEEGNYWCRPGQGHCGKSGWVDTLSGVKLTPEETRLRAIEAEQFRQKRRQEEMERRLTALEEMARCQDHLRYHQALTVEALDYWYSEGMTPTTIDTYVLGYCTQCPTYRESPSYTIPIFGYTGELVNIRHRLTQPNGTGKYRPHRAGLGSALFNASVLRDPLESVIITEGEKKAIVAQQSGFDTVGVCGQRNFKTEWLEWFNNIPAIFVALDPDATESAERLAGILGQRARVVDLPAKLDDMIVKFGAGEADIKRYLELARPIQCKQ